jgi:hypothetical protein
MHPALIDGRCGPIPALRATPRWAYAACALLVLAAFSAFGVTLGRYPLPYVDEPFFNYPPLRWLQGVGLSWRVNPSAPHADSLWAYHGTFFPWLQVATFHEFGLTPLACRMPQYLAAHLAIAVLAFALLRRGLWVSAIVCSLAWLGDRALQEAQYGRPEGLCLLALVVGMLALARWLSRASSGASFVAGFATATAAGFSPGSGVFLPATLALGLLLTPKGSRMRVTIAFLAGIVIPAVFQLATWHFDIVGSLAQLRWHHAIAADGIGKGLPLPAKLAVLFRTLRWGGPWGLSVLAVSALLGGYLVRWLASRRPAVENREEIALQVAASCYAAVGLVVFLISPKYPYYLVLTTVWPIVAVVTAVEVRSAPRMATMAAAILLAVTWLPSLAWNLLRAREAIRFWPDLAPEVFARQVGATIPADARVVGSPEIFALAYSVRIRFEPLPYFAQSAAIDPDAWLVLTDSDLRGPGPYRISCETLRARGAPVLGEGFPNAHGLTMPFVIYRPESKAARISPPAERPRDAPTPCGVTNPVQRR